MAYIIRRLKEPSTLAGLGVLAAIFGVPPGTIELGSQVLAGALGLAAMFMPEASTGQ